jgi:hypothetical protein
MTTYEGGCLCGKVRFRVAAEAIETGYCHCRMCQRNTGAGSRMDHVSYCQFFLDGTAPGKGAAGGPQLRKSGGSDQRKFCKWRQDFALEMRRQGIAANATPRSVRGQTQRAAKDVFYRTQARGESYALREKLDDIVHGLSDRDLVSDPARAKLLETRKAIIQGWNAVADKLEAQGEIVLGGDVRYFAMHLPPVLTDRERLTEQFMRFVSAERSEQTRKDNRVRDRTLERAR